MRSLLILTAGLIALPAAAAPIHQYAALTIAPGGDRIASVETPASPAAHGAIVVRGSADGRIVARIDPCATCSYGALAYGADGGLAFLMRDAQAGTTRLALARGTTVTVLASVQGIAQDVKFAPDGRSLAVLVTIGARKEAGAAQAGARQVGEIGAENDAQRIAVVPVAGGTLTPVSPAGRYVYEYDWLPDGTGFVATSAMGDGDANWWIATLDRIGRDGGVRRIAAPATQMNAPRVSPDGRSVAYIGGLMSDFGSVGGDVYVVPVAGGTPRNATPGFRGSFTSLRWDRAGLIGTALTGDRSAVIRVDPAHGPAAPLWSVPMTLSAGAARVALSANGGTLATIAQDYATPPAILAGPVSAPRPITRDNDAVRPIVAARSLTWRNGGHDVQGWLLTPLGAAATAKARGGKLPMITVVHGGPAAASVPAFVSTGTNAALLNAGYALFLPNPRGSYGQGEAFTRANMRDFGGGDLKDILAGVDAAAKAAPVDTDRLGLMGGSYGGFMSMWANTQTSRFKAIWAAAGLSNWVSYYGTNGINTWMIPFFGKSMYDDMDAYRRVSAIEYIKAARTPTLITVGERDIEVPPTQSVEYWNALKSQNVPTTLVIYPEEGHGIRNPKNAEDVTRRVTGWFDLYLK